MIKIPEVGPKFSLHKYLLKRAIAIERAEFESRLGTYQNLKQKIVAHHGDSGLEPTAEEFKAWCEGVELTRKMKISAQNIF